jgi:hypothetical protein
VQGHGCAIHSATVGETVVISEFDKCRIDAVFVIVRVNFWIGKSLVLCSFELPVQQLECRQILLDSPMYAARGVSLHTLRHKVEGLQ